MANLQRARLKQKHTKERMLEWNQVGRFGSTVHPRFSGPRLTGFNREVHSGSTGRFIQLFSLKYTRFTVEKD